MNKDYSEMARDYMTRLGVTFSQAEDFQTAFIQCTEALEQVAKEKDLEIERKDRLLNELNEAGVALRLRLDRMREILNEIWHEGVCAGKLKDKLSKALEEDCHE